MSPNLRRVLVAAVFSAVASTAPLAWADHDHGHGWGGGWGGGHGNVSVSHFDHGGFANHGGFGGVRFYSGRSFYGRTYGYSYRPYVYSYWPYTYGFYGYPSVYTYYGYPSSYYGYPGYSFSYPSDYYAGDSNSYVIAQPPYGIDEANAPPPREYIVSRPVPNAARLEIRLPDPAATIWVEGKEITSSGAVRQFNSPPLEPAHQYTYTIKVEWHDNGKLVSDERQVNVEANNQSIVDFTQPPPPAANTTGPALPDLPPPQPRPVQ